MKSRLPRIFLIAAVVILAALVVIYKTHRSNYARQAEPARSQPRLVSPPANPASESADAAPPIRWPVSAAAVEAAPTDLAARIKGLTPEQEAALLTAARDRDRARRVKEARYMLPTDRYLRSAGIKLSDDQQRRLQAVKDALKPRIDASLEGLWNQIDELHKQETVLLSSTTPAGQSDPFFQAQEKQLYQQLRVVTDQESAITNQLNEEYQVQVLAFLTPEQQTSYAQAVGAMMNNFSPAPKK